MSIAYFLLSLEELFAKLFTHLVNVTMRNLQFWYGNITSHGGSG
jgi:DNA-binding transcriptional regulator YbjK